MTSFTNYITNNAWYHKPRRSSGLDASLKIKLCCNVVSSSPQIGGHTKNYSFVLHVYKDTILTEESRRGTNFFNENTLLLAITQNDEFKFIIAMSFHVHNDFSVFSVFPQVLSCIRKTKLFYALYWGLVERTVHRFCTKWNYS